jgi:hypothetical protein
MARARRQRERAERSAAGGRKRDGGGAAGPVKVVHDRHVLERVVARRNDMYSEAAVFVPQGYVPNLESMHRLPPDNKFHAKDSPRIFYWG